MSFLILLTGILLLILLTTWAKLNAFLSFLLVSMGIGLANGMTIDSVTHAVQTGMGDMLGSLLVIIVVGAMIGKLIADYGAAQRIVSAFMKWFGRKYLVWALVITAFIVGIPLFYGIGFVLLVPLIITLSYKYDIPAVYIGLPMLASLSVTHGYLPPHPSPVALIQQYHADLGLRCYMDLSWPFLLLLLPGLYLQPHSKNIRENHWQLLPEKPFRKRNCPVSPTVLSLPCCRSCLSVPKPF